MEGKLFFGLGLWSKKLGIERVEDLGVYFLCLLMTKIFQEEYVEPHASCQNGECGKIPTSAQPALARPRGLIPPEWPRLWSGKFNLCFLSIGRLRLIGLAGAKSNEVDSDSCVGWDKNERLREWIMIRANVLKNVKVINLKKTSGYEVCSFISLSASFIVYDCTSY